MYIQVVETDFENLFCVNCFRSTTEITHRIWMLPYLWNLCNIKKIYIFYYKNYTILFFIVELQNSYQILVKLLSELMFFLQANVIIKFKKNIRLYFLEEKNRAYPKRHINSKALYRREPHLLSTSHCSRNNFTLFISALCTFRRTFVTFRKGHFALWERLFNPSPHTPFTACRFHIQLLISALYLIKFIKKTY